MIDQKSKGRKIFRESIVDASKKGFVKADLRKKALKANKPITVPSCLIYLFLDKRKSKE